MMTKRARSENYFFQFAFFAISAMLITIIVSQNTSNKTYSNRSQAASQNNPQIILLRTEGTTDREVYIKWTTSSPTTSYVAFDTVNTSFPGAPETWGKWRVNTDNAAPSSMVTSHSIRLGSLIPNTAFYYRVAGRTYPQTGNLVTSEVGQFTTLPSISFEISPAIHDVPSYTINDKYGFYFDFQTNVPTIFLEGVNELSTVSSSDPLQWVNYWKGENNWSQNYLRVNRSATVAYQIPKNDGKQYYYRVAVKDSLGRITISDPIRIYPR